MKPPVLMWYCRTPRGWRRFVVSVVKRQGAWEPEHKHGWVMDRGELVDYSEIGRYQLRTHEKSVPDYTTLETCNPYQAVTRWLNAVKAAKDSDAGAPHVHGLQAAREAYIRHLTDGDKAGNKYLEAAEQARVCLDEFLPLCEGIRRVKDIRENHVKAFMVALRKRGCSDRTCSNKFNRLRSWLKFCKVPTAFMGKPPKTVKARPTVYTKEQIGALRSNADATMLTAIDLCLKLGLREQECATAEWSDIDWSESLFRVQGKPEYAFTVKDREERDIPIPADLLAALKERHQMRPKGSKLIVTNRQGKPDGHLLRKLQQTAARAGVKPAKGSVSLHRLRRTYATTLLRAGLDVATVQEYMGHSDLASTQRYLSPDTETQARISAIEWE